MRTLLLSCCAAGLLASPTLAQQPITLEQVLERVSAKADAEEMLVALPEARLRLLESMSKRRFQFRPQLGLMSFSNPALLATSLGAGFSFSKAGAPSEFDVQNARFDLLAAKVAQQRARLRAQVDATQRFFDLLGKQQISAVACREDDMRERRARVDRLIAQHRLTELDRVRYQQEEQDARSACLEAESQRKLSALSLSAVLGSTPEASAIHAAESSHLKAVQSKPVQELENVAVLAMQSRQKLLREEIVAVRTQLHRYSSLRPAAVSFVYSNLGGGATGTADQYFLRGQAIHPEAVWNLGRRNKAENDTRREMLALRAKVLENELAAMENEIRIEVEKAKILTTVRREMLLVAQKKRELATRAETLIKTRFRHGLAGPDAVLEAEQRVRAAERWQGRVWQ